MARKGVKTRFPVPWRLTGCGVTAGLLVLTCLHAESAIAGEGQRLLGVAEADLTQEYRDEGFALAFLGLAEEEAIGNLGYSKEAVRNAVRDAHVTHDAADAQTRPDIVVILSESLWDPTWLPGVTFSKDPAPSLHGLQKEGADLRFLSPVFGGGTANVEFELLTGFSMRFLQPGSFPYVDPMFRRSQPSVVRFFATEGYRTLAIHNHSRTFWQRQHVYPRMGFDQFEGTEDAFMSAPNRGDYVADAALGEKVMQELDQSTRPTFLFAITMQNHGAYRPDRYDHFDVHVQSSKLSEKQLANLQTYTQGVYDTDAMLGTLTNYLRQRKRPTVLIYFGDHLPCISGGYDVQKDTGLVAGETTAEDGLRLHATPALVWANYPLKLHFEERVLSPGLIWPELLHAMGMEHPFYGQFLDHVRRELPGISRAVCVDAKAAPMLHAPSEADAILSDYRLLQHDLLEGERYSLGDLFSGLEVTSLARPVGQRGPGP